MLCHARRFIWLLPAFALLLGGCVTTNEGTAHNPKLPESSSSALLRPMDQLNVTLQGVQDGNLHAVQIDDQGLISLPFIGTIKAAGIGASELQQRIIDSYIQKKIYTNLAVAVSVAERYVYVGGEVTRPNRIVWSTDLTVVKAIQAAGGFSLYARETAVNLARDNATYVIDVKLAQRKPEEDPRLLPGDSIQVDRSRY